jgi:predicted nucleic acid-binding protein
MTVLTDTSALVAVIDTADALHEATARAWRELLANRARLVSTNYLLVELYSVLQRRFGMALVSAVADRIEPLLEVHWVDEAIHGMAEAAFLQASRRDLSLVDCTSFLVMRQMGLDRAFAVDPHFAEQGFEVLPELPVRQ